MHGRKSVKLVQHVTVLNTVSNYNIMVSFIVKIKVQSTLEQATKAQRWSRGTALLFL